MRHPRRSLKRGELRRGALACYFNAGALLKEAELLHEHGHHARALALAATGMQELAKARVCAGLLVGDSHYADFSQPKAFWPLWIDHEKKGLQAYLRSPSDPASLVSFTDREVAERYGMRLEHVRKIALYVNARESIPPTWPDEAPPKEPPSGWQVDFIVPEAQVRQPYSESLINNLRRSLSNFAERIAAISEQGAAESEKLANAIADEVERQTGTRPKVERKG